MTHRGAAVGAGQDRYYLPSTHARSPPISQVCVQSTAFRRNLSATFPTGAPLARVIDVYVGPNSPVIPHLLGTQPGRWRERC